MCFSLSTPPYTHTHIHETKQKATPNLDFDSIKHTDLIKMSIGIAQIKQVIGLRANVSNCISYQDEQTIVYPAGANVVVYNIDQKTQKFIPNSDKSTGLTTMCVSSNKRYIACTRSARRRRSPSSTPSPARSSA